MKLPKFTVTGLEMDSAVKARSMKDSRNLALGNYGECRASGNGMAGLDMAVPVFEGEKLALLGFKLS